MPKGVTYDGEYIVGGRPNARLSPNFSVGEFSLRGTVFVARELVAGLQELREGYGAAVKVESLSAADGLGADRAGRFAFVSAADGDRLAAVAAGLERQSFFARVARAGSRLYVECVDPDNPPPLPAEDAFDRGMRVTAAYETSGDPYQQVTGNFDGAGLSFGPLQVNFGTGTLQPLFARFEQADPIALAACFGRPEDHAEWRAVLAASRARQVRWADEHSTGSRKAGFAEPWAGYLRAVGRVETFRRITREFAYEKYGRKLIIALSWLKGLWPGKIDDFRCLAALYDLCVQQGSLDKAHDRIRRRVQREQPADQITLTHIAVEERGNTARSQYRADCVSRRLGILYREPRKVTIAGVTSERDNPRLYLVRGAKVQGAEKYLG